MRVFLDASAAAKAARTGVGHYVARLAEALLAVDPALDLTLGVRLGRVKRGGHVLRPPAGTEGRARVRWFPSFWPGFGTRGADVVHGPDARVVRGGGRQVVTVHDLFSLKSHPRSVVDLRAPSSTSPTAGPLRGTSNMAGSAATAGRQSRLPTVLSPPEMSNGEETRESDRCCASARLLWSGCGAIVRDSYRAG